MMLIFEKGQLVVHCRDGLATVSDETTLGDKEYFIVRTLRGGGENIYVPKDRSESIIRPIMSEKKAEELIAYIRTVELEYNSNTKQRRDSLKRRLMSGDVNDIAYLYKQLYFYKTQTDGSIKFGPVDLDMLNFASNNLLDEFAVVYKKDRNEIEDFIDKKLA